ncbi:MAG: HU family DNA-binding protein, partial [Gemmatimonadetes bacterium]|nr:HU family DNA-binding protein [Gemmatimonadota bacterium]
MKKKDFIERVAEKAELTRAEAARTVEAIFDAAEGAIVAAVRAGEHISLPGFGKFKTKTRGARKGRNPRTGKEINIPERTVMHFSSGKGVADTLAGKKSTRRKKSAA